MNIMTRIEHQNKNKRKKSLFILLRPNFLGGLVQRVFVQGVYVLIPAQTYISLL